MAAGIQIFNESGNKRLEITNHLPKYLGNKTLTGSGSYSIPTAYSNNKLWYYITSKPDCTNKNNLSYIRLTNSGRTISWANISGNATIIYGIY